jgi:hypothetical protein
MVRLDGVLLLLLVCIGWRIRTVSAGSSGGATADDDLDDLNKILTPAVCNQTGYAAWQDKVYVGPLATNPTFWRYQGGQNNFVLKNGLALELVVADCTSEFTNLITYKAGRSGPVTIQFAYKAMCSDYCIEADRLSVEALKVTGCSCLQLSTQPGTSSYSKPGDWCGHNTARLLCDILGFCGVWNCRIDDFMCPRYEWNKKTIDLKGPGTCVRGAASTSYTFVGALYGAVVLLLSLLLWS